jgi:hypothetical protein
MIYEFGFGVFRNQKSALRNFPNWVYETFLHHQQQRKLLPI